MPVNFRSRRDRAVKRGQHQSELRSRPAVGHRTGRLAEIRQQADCDELPQSLRLHDPLWLYDCARDSLAPPPYVIVVAVLAGGLVLAGRGAPPRIDHRQARARSSARRARSRSRSTRRAPRLSALTIALEQNGRTDAALRARRRAGRDRHAGRTATTCASRARSASRASRRCRRRRAHRRHGGAASRSSKLRTLSSAASKDIQVRLEPPRIAVVSTHHYVNHGGSEMVVYRATPPDVQSGVRVGDVEYPGFRLGRRAADADPA